MANDPDNIVIGASGTLSFAPIGTALPDTVDGALNAAFKEVGFLSEDGVTPTRSQSIEGVPVWQSVYHVRRFITEAGFKVSMVLREWNKVTVPLAFGGGAVTESPASSGSYRYDFPDPSDIDERAMVLDWNDGERNFRLVVAGGNIAEDVETTIARSGPSDLPITFEAIKVTGEPIAYWMTDDPNFA